MMLKLYDLVLIVCLILALALIAWRLRFLWRQTRGGHRPSPGRLWNEWAWTLVPAAVLLALLWRAV